MALEPIQIFNPTANLFTAPPPVAVQNPSAAAAAASSQAFAEINAAEIKKDAGEEARRELAAMRDLLRQAMPFQRNSVLPTPQPAVSPGVPRSLSSAPASPRVRTTSASSYERSMPAGEPDLPDNPGGGDPSSILLDPGNPGEQEPITSVAGTSLLGHIFDNYSKIFNTR